MSKLFIFFILLSIVVGLFTKNIMMGVVVFIMGAFIKIMLNLVKGVGNGP